jgi:L-asparaginase
MKNILVIATGGTIASAEEGAGLAPAVSGEELLRQVPGLAGLCRPHVVQLMNIDSTNMRPADWRAIQRCIVENYAAYDGFVVLHGTDTMAYTAAALSYLIQRSAKPVVLTGSQKPMGNPFTDARLNLYQALLYASDDASHGVVVVFGGEVIAGTRARKQRSMSFNAFTSVNFPALALIRDDAIVRVVPDPKPAPADLRVYDLPKERVFALKLVPGIDPHIFELLKPTYGAVIVETFGVGGIPSYADEPFERAIFDWVASGRTLAVTTQVPEEGCDLGVYEVGRAYADNPAILKGGDMTTEALVAKTMWARGVADRGPDAVAERFYRPVNHDRLLGV